MISRAVSGVVVGLAVVTSAALSAAPVQLSHGMIPVSNPMVYNQHNVAPQQYRYRPSYGVYPSQQPYPPRYQPGFNTPRYDRRFSSPYAYRPDARFQPGFQTPQHFSTPPGMNPVYRWRPPAYGVPQSSRQPVYHPGRYAGMPSLPRQYASPNPYLNPLYTARLNRPVVMGGDPRNRVWNGYAYPGIAPVHGVPGTPMGVASHYPTPYWPGMTRLPVRAIHPYTPPMYASAPMPYNMGPVPTPRHMGRYNPYAYTPGQTMMSHALPSPQLALPSGRYQPHLFHYPRPVAGGPEMVYRFRPDPKFPQPVMKTSQLQHSPGGVNHTFYAKENSYAPVGWNDAKFSWRPLDAVADNNL